MYHAGMATTMPPPIPAPVLDAGFLSAFRSGKLTEQQADAFARRDPLELRFLLMQLSLIVAAGTAPTGTHTPSGSIPPYAEPNAEPRKNKKKRGAKPGHQGASRPIPEQVANLIPQSSAWSSLASSMNAAS